MDALQMYSHVHVGSGWGNNNYLWMHHSVYEHKEWALRA